MRAVICFNGSYIRSIVHSVVLVQCTVEEALKPHFHVSQRSSMIVPLTTEGGMASTETGGCPTAS